MKVLTQGDDYGFTKAVTYGILDAIDNGVLRNTGLFANMPIAPWAVDLFGDREACLGIDFNIVSGPPCAPAREIPALLDEEGQFVRSGVRLKDERYRTEEGRRAMFPYDQVYAEMRAQYDRFVALRGKKPGYLHAHSLTHEHYLEAIAQISREEGVPYSADLHAKYDFVSSWFLSVKDAAPMKPGTPLKKEFDPMEQLNKDPLGNVLAHRKTLEKAEYVMIGGHPGFVDAELMSLTTLSLERMRDHEMMVSPVLRRWLEDADATLITYYDLT